MPTEDKLIVLAAHCYDPYASDTPPLFAVSLDTRDIQRIRDLAQVVKDNRAEEITVSYYREGFAYTWFDFSDIPDDTEPSRLRDTIRNLIDDRDIAYPTEDCLLHIGDEQFHFSSVPKHMDQDMTIYTDPVDIALLSDSMTSYAESVLESLRIKKDAAAA